MAVSHFSCRSISLFKSTPLIYRVVRYLCRSKPACLHVAFLPFLVHRVPPNSSIHNKKSNKKKMVATKIEGVIADADARYTFDETKLAELRKSSPWKDDPRYFQSVAIGPSAVMKMVSLVSFVLLIFTRRPI